MVRLEGKGMEYTLWFNSSKASDLTKGKLQGLIRYHKGEMQSLPEEEEDYEVWA